MQQTIPSAAPPDVTLVQAPSFYLTGRQTLRPWVLLLAALIAAAALFAIVYAMSHSGRGRLGQSGSGAARAGGSSADDDKDDDPSQIDTIVLGGPDEAPVPGKKGDHVSPVHATIVVVLPRFGPEFGKIPNTPSGQLLYAWLAAFNKADADGLARALPSGGEAAAVRAELALRRQNGGFNLLSSKEAVDGVLVFRLMDQTPAATEVLGTLAVRPGSNPAEVGSFNLRSVDEAEAVKKP